MIRFLLLALFLTTSISWGSVVIGWSSSTKDTVIYAKNTKSSGENIGISAYAVGTQGAMWPVWGIRAQSCCDHSVAIRASSTGNHTRGVYASGDTGVVATGNYGVKARGVTAVHAVTPGLGSAIGVYAEAHYGTSVYALSNNGKAIRATSGNNVGVEAISTGGVALKATSTNSLGVDATSTFGVALKATSTNDFGIDAASTHSNAINATSTNSYGVRANSTNSTAISAVGAYGGIDAYSDPWIGGTGVSAYGNTALFAQASGAGGGTSYGLYAQAYSATVNYGVYAIATGVNDYAGFFDGNVAVTGFCSPCSPSDAKLKKNVRPIEAGLSTIMALKPKTYEMRTDEFKGKMSLAEGKQHGLIAQEVEMLLPELIREISAPAQLTSDEKKKGVRKPSTEFKAVNYQALIPILIRAIQEQQARIEELERSR